MAQASVSAVTGALSEEVLREAWAGSVVLAVALHPSDLTALETPPLYFVRPRPSCFSLLFAHVMSIMAFYRQC